MFYGRPVQAPSKDSDDEFVLWTRGEIQRREFCNMWRRDPAVVPRLIASDVSDLRVQLMPATGQDRATMRIGLTWTEETSDEIEEAHVLVEVNARMNAHEASHP